MATRDEVYTAIDSERDYQDRVWHRKENTDPTALTIGEYILLLEEYTAHARREWTLEPKPEVNSLEFIRKVGGIAVNCMEQHGAPHREG